MSDSANGAPVGEMPTGEQPQGETPPAWFQQFKDEITGRLGKLTEDVISVRKKTKQDAPSKVESAGEKPAGLTKEDLDAAMRLGEVRSKLPEKARERIQSLVEQRGYAAALEAAELIAEYAGPAGEMPAASGEKPLIGLAGTAAPSRGVQFPRSIPELIALKKADAKRYAEVMAHPQFDPSLLPRS